MKRFLLFAGEAYYPSGGWDDFVEDFDTIDEAVSFASDYKIDIYTDGDGKWLKARLLDVGGWAHVVDTHTQEVTDVRQRREEMA